MTLSSPFFIFLFLPIVFTLYYISKKEWNYVTLFIISYLYLFFCFGKNPATYIYLLLVSVCAYLLPLINQKKKIFKGLSTEVLFLSLFVIMRLLFATGIFTLPKALPFFDILLVLNAVNYVKGIINNDYPVEKNVLKVFSYLSFFPSLIVIPNVSYKEFTTSLITRKVFSDATYKNTSLLMSGFVKRIILCYMFSSVYELLCTYPSLSAPEAVLGIVCAVLLLLFEYTSTYQICTALSGLFGINELHEYSLNITRGIRTFSYSLMPFTQDFGKTLPLFFALILPTVIRPAPQTYLIGLFIAILLLVQNKLKPVILYRILSCITVLTGMLFFSMPYIRLKEFLSAIILLKPLSVTSKTFLIFNRQTLFVFILLFIIVISPLVKKLLASKVKNENFFELFDFVQYIILCLAFVFAIIYFLPSNGVLSHTLFPLI